jgi:hypothetical protein
LTRKDNHPGFSIMATGVKGKMHGGILLLRIFYLGTPQTPSPPLTPSALRKLAGVVSVVVSFLGFVPWFSFLLLFLFLLLLLRVLCWRWLGCLVSVSFRFVVLVGRFLVGLRFVLSVLGRLRVVFVRWRVSSCLAVRLPTWWFGVLVAAVAGGFRFLLLVRLVRWLLLVAVVLVLVGFV